MLSKYGLAGALKLTLALIYTKIFFRKARLIRLPFDIRNRRYISIGKNLTTGVGCRLEACPSNDAIVLHFGENIQMNDYVHITAMESVSIGNNVLIASKVYISDCSHGQYSGSNDVSHPDTPPITRSLYSKKVVIEENVWICEFVSILPGVTIGKGSIIGTMSVVTKSIPPYCVAVGAPAKVIKIFNFTTQLWEPVLNKNEFN
jgi:acetyltransferase-like isoleucine patch superfamily enzyme